MKRVKMVPMRHPADEHQTDRVTRFGAGAGHEDERQVTRNRRDRRHQDRPQSRCGRLPLPRRLYRSPVCCSLLANSTIRIAFLAIKTDERDQSDLGIDVHRRRPAIGEKGNVRLGILRKVKMSAPNMASGTEPSRMMNGSRKLLNCAARTRKMRTTARPNAGRNLSPSTRSCRDSPV